MAELVRRPAVELRRLIAAGELSAEELTRACLGQIERDGRAINAVVTLDETALDQARALDARSAAGHSQALLHGLPVGIKDVTEVGGLRTTYGSRRYADHTPVADALVVERLRRAGAVILGKTNTPEFATGGNTFNEVFGRTHNPWNLGRSAGGSTGGGAAGLASGMIALAEGTDLGGSLRIPASFCGVVGLRPSPGLVPTVPSSFLWDSYQVTGGMGRTAADVALMIQATAGPSPRSPMNQPTLGRDFVAAVAGADARGLRIAYCPDIVGIGIDADVERVCRDAAFALADAGAEVSEIELDLSFAWEPFLALRGLWMVVQQHHRLDRVGEMGENLAGNVRRGLATTTEALGAAEQVRGVLWRRFHELFERFDHLVTPCMAVPPFPVTDNFPETVGGRPMATYIDWVAPTFVLSMTGLPVVSVPSGLDAAGLPTGLQIVGRTFDDVGVFRAARHRLGEHGGEEGALALASIVERLRPIGSPALTRS